MLRYTIPSLLALLLLGTSSGAVTDIRKVDFLNFTYPSTTCSEEYGKNGIPKTIHVRNGELKNRTVYFGVERDKIVFGLSRNCRG